jgi:hypothetical protein
MYVHVNEDGTIPCTNCGKEIEYVKLYWHTGWRHINPRQVTCKLGVEGVACPLSPNEDADIERAQGNKSMLYTDMGIELSGGVMWVEA